MTAITPVPPFVGKILKCGQAQMLSYDQAASTAVPPSQPAVVKSLASSSTSDFPSGVPSRLPLQLQQIDFSVHNNLLEQDIEAMTSDQRRA